MRVFRKRRRTSPHKEEEIPTQVSENIPCVDQKMIQLPLSEVVPRDMQQSLRGSKKRFSEEIDYNLSLLTKLLPTKNLLCERFLVGDISQTRVILTYLNHRANPGIVQEVGERIKGIKTDIVLDSIYIERNIEDSHLSPFPQIEATQEPDVAESALLQGRVAIFVDSSPDVLLAPATFFDLMDTKDDVYMRWFIAASFFRIARYVMFFIATSLPALFIALSSYNPEMLPTKFLLLLLASREETPLPIYIEAFIMMGVIEAIRMMMIRMPSQVGTVIALLSGITLVIAGLSAGFIGPGVVIMATLAMIASFGLPNFDLRISVRMIQFFTMLMTTVLGIFGFAVAFFMITVHLATLKSFGIPYTAPLAPLEPSGWGHTILRKTTEQMPQDETYQPLGEQR
ncbi:spore germination protein [Candidatus Formimonas warabiya]|nr:spore germination protein [Candidatus Formimonas warabiya]